VVGVVMRDENVGQVPAGRLERRLDRGGLRGVNRGGGAAFRVMQQHPVIVGSAGKQPGFRGHGTDPSFSNKQIANSRLDIQYEYARFRAGHADRHGACGPLLLRKIHVSVRRLAFENTRDASTTNSLLA
jgi:hypothetical protein